MGAAISITRLDLTASELRKAAGGEKSSAAARRILALALVLNGVDRKSAALVRLPPYAPELNPIENVWEYLRGNKLAITVFDDYDDIIDKTCDAWNFFEKDPTRIASITTRTWAKVSI
jgi:transposase